MATGDWKQQNKNTGKMVQHLQPSWTALFNRWYLHGKNSLLDLKCYLRRRIRTNTHELETKNKSNLHNETGSQITPFASKQGQRSLEEI